MIARIVSSAATIRQLRQMRCSNLPEDSRHEVAACNQDWRSWPSGLEVDIVCLAGSREGLRQRVVVWHMAVLHL